jgi:hypothetical protein
MMDSCARGLGLAGLFGLALLGVAGCHSVGPKTIRNDRFDYGEAIASSWHEQLLLNMVRLRYMEAPVFLEVNSVINQYGLEGEVALSAGFGTAFAPAGSDTQQVGGVGRWSDRPTITYTPLTGRDFSRSLLTPLTPEALFALVQSGWPGELVFGLTLSSVNGIENRCASPARRGEADPRFRELLGLWGELFAAGVIGLRLDEADAKEGKRTQVVIFRNNVGERESVQRDLERLYELLGVDEAYDELHLVYGLVPSSPDEVAVISGSILDIMLNLAWQFDVPAEHVEEGRTGTSFISEDAAVPHIDLVCGTEPLETAFISVRNRGWWFSLDDRDLASKRTFAFLQIVLSLADTGNQSRGPVVSISN